MQEVKRILVIAPHPDDEVLGCGGTISRFGREGKEVFILYITKDKKTKGFEKEREEEIKKVSEILKIKKYFRLNYQTAELDITSTKKLSNNILMFVKNIKPDLVFIPFIGDSHQDHRKASEASLIALRPFSFSVKIILMYETLSETEWGSISFHPNLFVEISKEDLSNKVAAMKLYKTEIKKAPHPRSIEIIESLARMRGSTVGKTYAEAFKTVRVVLPIDTKNLKH